MQNLGWVDITALSVIGVFCVIGLFKGFLWQTSRIAILAAAYAAAASLGQGFADVLVGWTHGGQAPPTADQRETAFFIACVLIFLGVLIALSLAALLLQSLVQKAGLGFYDRLGGGAFGVATGGLVVLFLLGLVLMFFPRSHVAAAADASHSLRFSQKVVAALGGVLPDEMQRLFEPKPDPKTEPERDSKTGPDPAADGDGDRQAVAPLPRRPSSDAPQPPRAPNRDH
jgi:membrane protein required for colicin V production